MPILPFKIALYVLTIGAAFFCAFWERRRRLRLTDEPLELQHQDVSDYGALYVIKEEIRRERILKSLPRETLAKLRLVGCLKFLFLAVLAIEVVLLQR
ncbi:hypothetical protein [Occallatibacter riparius]|uniref:Uncharacterized protein n=1 Tax=Occallatibacter riparius TaxID=1002689 RepID=A0A9J7BHW0_9BACT|nr:hypothetical protein [Occallatibacter riparius]UWZ82384.1 hypothetical protein MOP44_17615 [Occallatibacter riparius]